MPCPLATPRMRARMYNPQGKRASNRQILSVSPKTPRHGARTWTLVCLDFVSGMLVEVKPSDIGNDLSDFVVCERWSAAHPVPGQKQFQHHLWINLVP